MTFEWDETKRISNLAKHGLDFAKVLVIFYDPDKVEKIDARKDYGEVRMNTVGRFRDEIIASVIHTDRNGVTRIISARKASRKERKEYYYGNR